VRFSKHWKPRTMKYTLLKNWIIHEEKTKRITAVSVVLYVIKNHVHLYKF
jgi:hypothetical protein